MPTGIQTPPYYGDPAPRSTGSKSASSSTCASLTNASTPMRNGMSIPHTPDTLHPIPTPASDCLASIDPAKSPSSLGPISPTSHMPDTTKSTKGTGLMRRVSNKLRPRASASNLKNRDQSSGPMVVRGRSSSRTVTDGAHDVSDLELDSVDECDSTHHSGQINGSSATPTSPRKVSEKYMGGNGEIIVPNMLLQGTRLTKYTRKKHKPLRVWLDRSHSKLSWSADGSSSVKHLYVDDIKEIRTGNSARAHAEEYGVEYQDLNRWFTVTFSDPDKTKGRATKALHLLAPNKDVCDEWKGFLQFLIRDRGEQMAAVTGNPNEESLTHYWNRTKIQRLGRDAPDSHGEWFSFRDFVKYCRSHSIWKSESDLWALFRQFDTKRTGTLDQGQYLDITYRIMERRDIRRVFDAHKAKSAQVMDLEDFLGFLSSSQGVDVAGDLDRCQELFARYTSKRTGLGISVSYDRSNLCYHGMTFDDFQDFLLSDADNPTLATPNTSPSFNRPLNEYFISSSHNTYLMGRQVAGHSNSEGYIEALRKGCRCVEIDCWDGDDGKPKVTHGRTLSTWTSFEDCIKVIDQYAFYSSRFPLIISLEVHCNPMQQKIMADIMKRRFGTKLLLEPLSEDAGVLPSPEALKGKILIKVKEPKQEIIPGANSALSVPLHKRQRSKSEADVRPSEKTTAPQVVGTEGTDPLLLTPQPRAATFNSPSSQPRRSTTNGTSSVNASSSDDSGSEIGGYDAPKKRKAKTSNIVPSLGDLGVYTRGIKFSDFKSPQSKTYNHIFSFNENTFEDKCKAIPTRAQMERHNQHYLMRVYPKAIRYNSSNFDPLQFWRRGVQMVATNWQTYDLGTQINDAMFAAGFDRTGYVLKPDELRLPRFDATCDSVPGLKKKIVQFSVQVLSARRLDPPPNLRSEMNPYVEIEMYSADNKARGLATAEGGTDISARNGMSGIGFPTRRRTHIIESNGYDPVFDQQISLKLETEYPSLVFVRWTLWHSPDGRNQSPNKEPLSSFTAKLSTLQQGYHTLKLHNKHGEETISELFCRIHKEDPQEIVERQSRSRDDSPESPRASEDGTRSGRDILRSVFRRTPSERPKAKKAHAENTSFSRTTSVER